MSTVVPDWMLTAYRDFVPAGSVRARLSAGVFWAVAGAVISRGFALVTTIFCARILGVTEFGALSMIQSTLGMFGIFAGLGLGLTATKYVAELRGHDPGRASRVLALSTWVALIAGGLTSIVLIVLAPYLATHALASPQLSMPLAIGSGLVFFGAMNGTEVGALAGFEDFKTIAGVSMLAGLLSFPLAVTGVLYGGLNGAVWGFVAGSAVTWAFNHFALRRRCAVSGIRYRLSNWRSELGILYRFSLPAFLASAVIGPAVWIANAILVHQKLGYTQLGIYAAADKWRLLILFIPTSAFGIVLPVLSNLHGGGQRSAFREVFGANLRLNAGLAFLAAVPVIAFAKAIMASYGTGFQAGRPVLVLLALSALPESLNTIFGQPLVAAHMMWWRFAFDLLLVALLVFLAWILIPRWGAFGLASSYTLAYSATSLGLFFFLRFRVWNRALPANPLS